MAPLLRLDPADPTWPDRDRIVRAATLPPGPGETLAGPPGLALAAALGMAATELTLAARFGRSLVDHRIWLFTDTAGLQGGAAFEAAELAGLQRLDRLCVIAVTADTTVLHRFALLGWAVRIAASEAEFASALAAARRARKPALIAAASAGIAATLTESPASAGARRSWLKRLHRHAMQAAFRAAVAGTPPRVDAAAPGAAPALAASAAALLPLPPPRGAMADWLTDAPDPLWSTRPAALAGALLGAALHGGVLPAGRFTAETGDSLAAAQRIAVEKHVRLLRIVLPAAAQDQAANAPPELPGPVFTPGDADEESACTQYALVTQGSPVTLALAPAAPHSATPQQGTPAPALSHRPDLARGAYALFDPEQPAITLIASGPTLAPALALHADLAARGIPASLLSVPCWARFAACAPADRDALLRSAPRLLLGGPPLARIMLRMDDEALDAITPERALQRALRLAQR